MSTVSLLNDWIRKIEDEHERTLEAIAVADAALVRSEGVLRDCDNVRENVRDSQRDVR